MAKKRRDPNRIPGMLKLIQATWSRHPDMRLAQLISSAATLGGWDQKDTYYCDDDTLQRGLEKMLTWRTKRGE